MTGETVMITGASSGIGRDLAHCFAADRSTLVLVARRRAELEKLAAELGDRVTTHVLAQDLADQEAPARITAWLDEHGLVVDVLVNNAGFGEKGAFAEQGPATQLEMIQVNVTALVDLTRRLLPGMIGRRRGGVLNVGSMAGFVPGPGLATYYATKAFVNSLTEALAEETRGTGVTVTLLAPGPVRTGFADRAGLAESLAFQARAVASPRVAEAAHRAFRRGDVIAIPDLGNRATLLALRALPRVLVRRAVHRFQAR